MKEKYRILTVNPGSTSTKVALFEEDEALFMTTVEHESAVPGPVQEQLAYRNMFRYKPCIPDLSNTFNTKGCCIQMLLYASKEMIM